MALREPEPSALRYYGGIVWRRRWFLLVPLVLLPIVGFVASERQEPVYSASANVLLNHQSLVASSLTGVEAPVMDEGRYADTQAQLATVPAVARRVLAALDLHDRTAHDLLQHVSATPYADMLVFEVTDPDPAVAARLSGEFARQFTAYRRELDTRELARTLDGLDSRLATLEREGRSGSSEYTQLAQRKLQVQLLEGLRKSEVYVVRTSTSDDADKLAPRPRRDAALLGAAGLVLGLLLVALANALDTRVTAPEEVEEALGLPRLGRVGARTPRDPAGAASGRFTAVATSVALAAGAAEARSILVAGSRRRDGAGAAAVALAYALAGAGQRVLLVDLDLRGREATQALRLERAPGFVDALRGGRGLAAHAVALGDVPHSGIGGEGVLEAVPAGAAVGEPSAPVVTARIGELLRDAAEGADVLLVAGPPLLEAPEALAVASGVDGIVLLVRRGSLRRERLGDLRRLLAAAPAAGLGFVFDDARTGRWPGIPLAPRRPRGGGAEHERVSRPVPEGPTS